MTTISSGAKTKAEPAFADAPMPEALQQAMDLFMPELPLLVGYSGGADSTALLLACAERWPGQVQAVHVHHGLQAAADDFAQHCAAFCASLHVPLRVMHVQAGHALGESPEDAARKARYKAFNEAAQVVAGQGMRPSVVLAQHADDQIETMLLALSRGAGLPGLSSMPAEWLRDGWRFYRPFLDVPGGELRRWLAARGVSFVEDPTNVDERYTRNRIRAKLLPALEAVFPQFRSTFARSAAHAAQAQALLEELAAQDLAQVGVPPSVAALRGLTSKRQGNLLRYWLKTHFGVSPSATQLKEALRQIAACSTRGHQIRIKVGDGFLQRNGALLDWYNSKAPDRTD